MTITCLIDVRKDCPVPYARCTTYAKLQEEMDKSLGFNEGEGWNNKKLVNNLMRPNWVKTKITHRWWLNYHWARSKIMSGSENWFICLNVIEIAPIISPSWLRPLISMDRISIYMVKFANNACVKCRIIPKLRTLVHTVNFEKQHFFLWKVKLLIVMYYLLSNIYSVTIFTNLDNIQLINKHNRDRDSILFGIIFYKSKMISNPFSRNNVAYRQNLCLNNEKQ